MTETFIPEWKGSIDLFIDEDSCIYSCNQHLAATTGGLKENRGSATI